MHVDCTPSSSDPAVPRSLQLSEEALHRMGSAVLPLGMREVRALTLALAGAVQEGDKVGGCVADSDFAGT